MSLWIYGAGVDFFFFPPARASGLDGMSSCGDGRLYASTAHLISGRWMPDVIGIDELTTGQRREGFFMVSAGWLQKIGLALDGWELP